MLEKRIRLNLFYICLSFLICMTVWQTSWIPRRASSDVLQYDSPTFTVYTNNSSAATDYNKLINLTFTFTTLNLVCNDSSPLVLVLVHSSPHNFVKRKTIRETWGRNDENVKLLFMLGIVEDADIHQELEEENNSYRDFIQGNFLDTYRNITYKHVMLFKYVIYHCPLAKYVLKTDDDVFVNMPTMINFLTSDLSLHRATKMILCTPRRNVKAERSFRSKWRVSFHEYPQRNYPTYCPGWALLYSVEAVYPLYKEAQKSQYFWIDDVHVTGTLADKVGIKHTNIEALVISNENLDSIIRNSNDVVDPFLYGRANMDEKQIRALWNYSLSHEAPKSVLRYIWT